MKKYIEQEAAIALSKEIVVPQASGVDYKHRCIDPQDIRELPAADVVEVDVKDLRVKKAIKTLCEFYSTAKKSDYVQKPLAWALYQTWKSFDKMDGGGDK